MIRKSAPEPTAEAKIGASSELITVKNLSTSFWQGLSINTGARSSINSLYSFSISGNVSSKIT